MTGGATRRLTAVSVGAATLAMLPLFPITESHGWLVPAVIGMGLVAMAGWALRRWGAAQWLVPLAQVGVLIWWAGFLVAGDVAWWAVIPNRAWLERMVTRVGEGIAAINEYAPPVPVEDGLLLIIVTGAGLVGLGVDVAVFGLRRVPLAGLPLALMFTVAASVAREGWSWLWFALPAIGYLMLLIAEGRARVVAWGLSAGPSARHQGRPETDSLARSGRRAGAFAVAAAVAVPAVLPVLTDGPIGFGGGSGGGRTIRTDNPIVDLNRDLKRPDNVPMLQYTTDSTRREYIRTVTLDVFDGEEWKPSSRPLGQHVSDGLPWPPGLRLPEDEPVLARYEFSITDNFRSRWLPLVYPALRVDIDGDWRVIESTLDVVANRDEDVDGTTYSATSLVVGPEPAELRDAQAPEDPGLFQEQFAQLLEVPDETRELLEPFIDDAIGDLTNRHERAVALQSWFRSSGLFRYSLETVPGTSSSALLDFLTDGSGYCEQFSATMAIMARVLGIPARVAVGFTPGEQQDDGSWLVRAHDAHAWPELYFPGTGWVRFEPTPGIVGRTGSPPPWTRAVPEEDDDPTGSAGGPDGSSQSPDGAEEPRLDQLLGDLDGGFGGEFEQPSRWPYVLLGMVVVGVVLMTPLAVARAIRARRWRVASGDAVLEAEAAWSDLRDAVRDAGLQWDPAATPRGMRRHLGRQAVLVADDRELLDRLVHAVERARYAARSDHVPGLGRDAAALRAVLLHMRSWRRRLRAVLWPAAISDLFTAAGNRLGDGLEWLDTTGERLRAHLPARLR